MFEEVISPIKLEDSPIKEAVFEIRISTSLNNDEVNGVLLPVLRKHFVKTAVPTPIMQIPAEIRDNDINLRYSPCYSISDDNHFIMNFSARSISFSCLAPYISWQEWSNKFFDILADIKELDFFKDVKVERYGLRYIDELNGNIESTCNIKLFLGKNQINEKSVVIRTEIQEEDYIYILNISGSKNSTLLDIDAIKPSVNINFDNFVDTYRDTIKATHEKSKKYFFGILNNDYLQTLRPEYRR